MPTQNDFIVWAGGINANVLLQSNYAALGNLTSGVVAGKASGQQANKTWRQTSIMSSMIAKFIVDRVNQPVIDDGTIQTIETNFINAILSLFVIPNTGVVPGTYGPTVSITVQADGRVTALSNTSLVGGGVAAGTYTAPTLGITADGRIASAVSASYGLLGGPNQWTSSNNFASGASVNSFILDAKGSANGANLGFVGNGGTTPNKYVRARSGVMEWVNSAYSAVIATLTDAGSFSVPGNLTAGVNVNAAGAVAATGLVSGQAVQANAGNVTAFGGRLRASLGAFGSGDGNAGALLTDFQHGENFIDALNNIGWVRLPSGHVMQWGRGNTISGDQDVVSLGVAYTTGVWDVVACEGNVGGWGAPPFPNWTVFGVVVLNASQFAISVARSQGGAQATYAAGINYSYTAIGI